jgi:RimJ/RimL family protein N-acetyltransferase
MAEKLTPADAAWLVEWRSADEVLTAIEPTAAEIAGASSELAGYYSDEHNRRMMANEEEAFTAEAVAVYYRELRAEGGRPFLLQKGGALLGDGDLRNIGDGTAEVAILIGARDAQGRGLGTRYAIMLHVFAFQVLGLERLYISVIPANTASLRLFEKLGYEVDDSPAARDLIDDETDVTMSVSRSRFESTVGATLPQIRTRRRDPG